MHELATTATQICDVRICVDDVYTSQSVAFPHSIKSSLPSLYPQRYSRDKIPQAVSVKVGQVKVHNYYSV